MKSGRTNGSRTSSRSGGGLRLPPLVPRDMDPNGEAFVETMYGFALKMVRRHFSTIESADIAWAVTRSLSLRWLRDPESLHEETLGGLVYVALKQECQQRDIRGKRRDRNHLRSLVERGVIERNDDGEPDLLDRASADAGVMKEEFRHVLRLAIEQMPPRRGRIMALRYLAGLGNPEIAAVLGMKTSTVDGNVVRGKKELLGVAKTYLAGESLPWDLRDPLREEVLAERRKKALRVEPRRARVVWPVVVIFPRADTQE